MARLTHSEIQTVKTNLEAIKGKLSTWARLADAINESTRGKQRPLSRQAVELWRTRGIVPPARIPALITVGNDVGVHTSQSDWRPDIYPKAA